MKIPFRLIKLTIVLLSFILLACNNSPNANKANSGNSSNSNNKANSNKSSATLDFAGKWKEVEPNSSGFEITSLQIGRHLDNDYSCKIVYKIKNFSKEEECTFKVTSADYLLIVHTKEDKRIAFAFKFQEDGSLTQTPFGGKLIRDTQQ